MDSFKKFAWDNGLERTFEFTRGFPMANLTEFYEKNNLFTGYALLSLADIFSCSILAGVSNIVVNCNDGIESFMLR